MSSCGLVILAAGGASRMGQAKQLLKLDGVSLLRRAAQGALASACRPIFVVLGANAAALETQIADLAVQVVLNAQWHRGIGSSIRVGVSAVAAAQPPADAVALVLCDQPLITAAHIDALVASRVASRKSIAAAAYAGILGTPAVFAAGLFEELTNLADHEGGKTLLSRHADDVVALDIPQGAIDVDTDADFQRLSSLLRASIQSGAHQS